MMKLQILIFAIVINYKFACARIVPNNKLYIMENEGFLAYIQPDNKFGNLAKCSIALPNGQIFDIDIKSEKPAKQKTPNNEVFDRFAKKYCGVRVQNLSIKSSGQWTLMAEDDIKYEVSEQLTIDVQLKHIVPKTKNETIGDKASMRVNCPNTDSSLFCRVFNKEGSLITNTKAVDCDAGMQSFSSKNDQFICRSLRWGKMDELETQMNYFIDSTKTEVNSYIRRIENARVLTCENINKISQCRAESPSGKQYLILDGLLTDHYSSYDTK